MKETPPLTAEVEVALGTVAYKTMLRHTVHGFLIALSLVGCGLTPESVSKDDERLKPLWAAIGRVDRKTLGFTEIAPNDRIHLEGKQLWGDDYDAMLHIDGETSRTIAFRKVGQGYEWIGEQEIHDGPKDYTTVDGTFKEHVSITYEIEHVSGAPLKTVYVQYFGEDPRLAHKRDLSLADVAKILQEWRMAR